MIKKLRKLNKQSQSELKAMADFYGEQYAEVYFVRDLLADRIIAVECYPANNTAAIVERQQGKRNIFGYQELLLSTRLRLDTNEFGHRMVGFESMSGNDTRLAAVERGDVPVTSGKKVTQHGPAAMRNLSPFERAQLQSAVAIRQASSKKKADYEAYTNDQGQQVERFETFEIVRVK